MNLIRAENEINQHQTISVNDHVRQKHEIKMINDWLKGKIVSDIVIKTGLHPINFVKFYLPSMKIAEAAGGIVRNADEEVLFIFRNNFWDLPKGHVDPGETHLPTALREVEEETGLMGIEVKEILSETWHFYQMHGSWWMKHTCWYDMRIKDKQLLNHKYQKELRRLNGLMLQFCQIFCDNVTVL
ncbi:MAG: NUDIX domain-containing protein [Bacteroidales bacterium]|nr:NUDIX domain-containing protein [Bacteroidales bacterium]